MGLPEAARRLGVSVRTLRHAMRAGTIQTPANMTATTALSSEWLAGAQSAAEASPGILSSGRRQKVPAFARYQGTSAWRKYSHRVRQYARFRAAEENHATRAGAGTA